MAILIGVRRIVLGIFKAIRAVLDLGDAVFAVIAFFVIVVLLASGRVPHDIELWTYGAAGFLLLLGVGIGIWGMHGRRRRRD